MGLKFDLSDGDFCDELSDDLLMDGDGHLMMRTSDDMAMDMESGELHLISDDDDLFGQDDDF